MTEIADRTTKEFQTGGGVEGRCGTCGVDMGFIVIHHYFMFCLNYHNSDIRAVVFNTNLLDNRHELQCVW